LKRSFVAKQLRRRLYRNKRRWFAQKTLRPDERNAHFPNSLDVLDGVGGLEGEEIIVTVVLDIPLLLMGRDAMAPLSVWVDNIA